MSFFVSKSLKNRVDESCLIEENIDIKKEPEREFVAVIIDGSDDPKYLQINQIKFNKDNTVTFSCNSNIVLVENVVFHNTIRKIIFKKKAALIKDSKIIEINRVNNDIYNLKVNCSLKLDRCMK